MKTNKITSDKQREETAARIRRKRESMGLTQEKMAENAGLSLDNYKKIEDGSNAMSITSLRCVQKALGVSFDYLLDGSQDSLDELWKEINACDVKEKIILLIKMVAEMSRTNFTEKEFREYLFFDEAINTNNLRD